MSFFDSEIVNDDSSHPDPLDAVFAGRAADFGRSAPAGTFSGRMAFVRAVCERFEFADALRTLRESSCIAALRDLETVGRIMLPPGSARKPASSRPLMLSAPVPPAMDVPARFDGVSGLEVRLVDTQDGARPRDGESRSSTPIGRRRHRNQLTGQDAMDQVPGSRARRVAGIPNRQLYPCAAGSRGVAPIKMAGGAFLQLDRAAFANQIISRRLGERRQNPDLDRGDGLSV